MKIGIDVRMIQGFPTGIGNYRENLIKALARLPSKHQFVLIGNVGNKMKAWSKNKPRFGFVAIRSKPNSVHQHFLLPFELRPLRLDLFWTTPWGASVFLWRRYALTIYDLLYRRYPKLASLKAKLYEAFVSGWVARRAVSIFTISEFVMSDVVNFLGVKKEKVFNIRGAAGEAYKPINDVDMKNRVLHKYGITRPLFVYLGNFRPHKNLRTLLQAFANIKYQIPNSKSISNDRMSNVKLVLIGNADAKGRDQDSQNLLNLLKQLKLRNDVILTRQIADDREVAAILNEAVALVHPSFHEGFGLTVLEAMSCGTPVIAANTTSIPEVVGDAGILVNPQSVEELAAAMEEILIYHTTKYDKYEDLVQRGLRQAKSFSWEKTAKEVLKIFASLNNDYWN